MSASVKDLANLFVNKQDPQRSYNAATYTVETDGTRTFRSYGVPIARWTPDGKLQVTTRKYSVTTSKHTSAVRSAAALAGIQYEQVDF